MTETSDSLLAELLEDMRELIEVRKPDMSEADLERASAWIAAVAASCAAATRYCDAMHYHDSQARAFMSAILRAMRETTRHGIVEASDARASVH